MTREEAIQVLQEKIDNRPLFKDEREAFMVAIEALSAEEAVWKEYEAEFTDLPDIPRYYYEKVVGKMAHEINVLKEQLESADAVQGEWLTGKGTSMMCPVCGTLFNKHTDFFDFEEFANFCPYCGARMKGGAE